MLSKLVATLALFSFLITGCSRSTDQAAKEQAAKTDEATSQSSTADISLPGMKPGSMPAGCYLRATIDGKKWEATEMTPDRSHPSIIPVNGQNGSSSIMFAISGMHGNIGKPSNLGEMNMITYFGGEGFFVGAKSGQVMVTKMDDQFIEGTFNFTAEKDGTKVTCTDGQFRVPSPTTPLSNSSANAVTFELACSCSRLPNDDLPGVTADDYNIWRHFFGTTSAAATGVASVPEPSAAAFVSLLLGTVCVSSRFWHLASREL